MPQSQRGVQLDRSRSDVNSDNDSTYQDDSDYPLINCTLILLRSPSKASYAHSLLYC